MPLFTVLTATIDAHVSTEESRCLHHTRTREASASDTRPGKGNDKGKVEGLVKYARKNFMVPIPNAPSFEALNEQLLAGCIRRQGDVLRGFASTIGARMGADVATFRQCGVPMRSRTGKYGRYWYYACARKADIGATACGGASIAMQTLDDLVTDAICERVLDPVRLSAMLKTLVARSAGRR